METALALWGRNCSSFGRARVISEAAPVGSHRLSKDRELLLPDHVCDRGQTDKALGVTER